MKKTNSFIHIAKLTKFTTMKYNRLIGFGGFGNGTDKKRIGDHGRAVGSRATPLPL